MFGCLLMLGYLGFDGFTSTWQDRMFKGYSMSVYNQILYVQLCSACVSLTSLVAFGQVRPPRTLCRAAHIACAVPCQPYACHATNHMLPVPPLSVCPLLSVQPIGPWSVHTRQSSAGPTC